MNSKDVKEKQKINRERLLSDMHSSRVKAFREFDYFYKQCLEYLENRPNEIFVNKRVLNFVNACDPKDKSYSISESKLSWIIYEAFVAALLKEKTLQFLDNSLIADHYFKTFGKGQTLTIEKKDDYVAILTICKNEFIGKGKGIRWKQSIEYYLEKSEGQIKHKRLNDLNNSFKRWRHGKGSIDDMLRLLYGS